MCKRNHPLLHIGYSKLFKEGINRLSQNIRIAVSLIGAAISFYLLLVKWLNFNSYFFCPTNGCEKVNQSIYSEVMGIPVSLFGVVVFILIINLYLHSQFKYSKLLLVLFIVGSFLFSLSLTWIEVFIIKEICFWCMIVFVCTAYLLIDLIFWIHKSRSDS